MHVCPIPVHFPNKPRTCSSHLAVALVGVVRNCCCQSSTFHISAHQESGESIVVCVVLPTDVKEKVEAIASIYLHETRWHVLALEESLEATRVAFPVPESQLVQLDDKVPSCTVGAIQHAFRHLQLLQCRSHRARYRVERLSSFSVFSHVSLTRAMVAWLAVALSVMQLVISWIIFALHCCESMSLAIMSTVDLCGTLGWISVWRTYWWWQVCLSLLGHWFYILVKIQVFSLAADEAPIRAGDNEIHEPNSSHLDWKVCG